MPTESSADQLPRATRICSTHVGQVAHVHKRLFIDRLSGYEMVDGCWGDPSFHMLSIENILLSFVSGIDGRWGPTGVPRCGPLQEDFPHCPPILRSRCNKETTAWDFLASCCAHTPKKRQRELFQRLHARVDTEVSFEATC